MSKPINLHRNLSLRVALQYARMLGFTIAINSRGEYELSHPALSRRIRADVKRHDCPRTMLTLLRQVASGKITPAPTVGKMGSKNS